MTAILELKDVSKRYPTGTVALTDISFSVDKGQFVSIIGPSGAGKSTLLRCINRLIDASGGEIRLEGENLMEMNKRTLRRTRVKIGMIFQHYNLVERLSVIENVLHGRLGYKNVFAGSLGIYSAEEKAKAIDILQSLGLEEQVYKRCDQLSGGQKQRVGIARALIQEPKLLLCDEPIASLDPNASKVIMDQLRSISKVMGITVLVNLHQVDVAMKYSDMIIGMKKGGVVFKGSAEEMKDETIFNIYGSEASELGIDIGESYAS
ncbi:phosphonate ABC transporter ATP-binding protein [Paenibacillus sp. J5C_2022]|uniref:phosphonate ABC transporter ATP-binding protein n=1 Tax=Paenibacillus sp. J5C2022 TaxID=2977129 RepID=UPI0021D1E4AA|nr:phosphonate ABC transporter ATP-binding protein [Paenibacillus sp. J5C2022]MCU6710182.1 phosphonate ABC transporter ATP-binding protein [Paenibacillus sp. J5C2022]